MRRFIRVGECTLSCAPIMIDAVNSVDNMNVCQLYDRWCKDSIHVKRVNKGRNKGRDSLTDSFVGACQLHVNHPYNCIVYHARWESIVILSTHPRNWDNPIIEEYHSWKLRECSRMTSERGSRAFSWTTYPLIFSSLNPRAVPPT